MKDRLLVIAPHPDDEVLGVGGTIARFADEGHDVYVAVATKGQPPHFPAEAVEQVRRELKEAHKFLGVRETVLLDLPAAAIDQIPHRDANAALEALLAEVEPHTLFLPFGGDIHLDHQLLFLSSLVAARPNKAKSPSRIYVYETLSETNWHAPFVHPRFAPSIFIDISDYIEEKLNALRIYRSQLRDYPHERSLEAVRALATLRGATIQRKSAEAFMLVRMVI